MKCSQTNTVLLSSCSFCSSDERGPSLYGSPLINQKLLTLGNRPLSSSSCLPVVVFSHGYGSIRTSSTALSCDLASHGFVLACVEHRDRSACTTVRKIPKPGAPGEYEDEWIPFKMFGVGKKKQTEEFPLRMRQVKLSKMYHVLYTRQRLGSSTAMQVVSALEFYSVLVGKELFVVQVQQRASEVGKALDLLQLLNEGGEVTNMMGERFDWGQFRGRLQLDTAAVMGHSFGGATTVHTLLADRRFKYAACMFLPSK